MTDQIPRPALGQFRDTVHAPPEDADGGQGEGAQEATEAPALAQRDEEGVLVEGGLAQGLVALVGPQGEVGAQEHEDEEC